jgi:hypothetical protein
MPPTIERTRYRRSTGLAASAASVAVASRHNWTVVRVFRQLPAVGIDSGRHVPPRIGASKPNETHTFTPLLWESASNFGSDAMLMHAGSIWRRAFAPEEGRVFHDRTSAVSRA